MNGGRSVEVFFLFSGFVFQFVYYQSIASGKETARPFFIKRFSRLYPLVFLVSVTLFIINCVTGFQSIKNKRTWGGLLLELTFTVGIFPWKFDIACFPLWSLSCEVIAYIIFYFAMALPPVWVTNNSLYRWIFIVPPCIFHVYKISKATNVIDLDYDMRIISGVGLFFLGTQIAFWRQHIINIMNFLIKKACCIRSSLSRSHTNNAYSADQTNDDDSNLHNSNSSSDVSWLLANRHSLTEQPNDRSDPEHGLELTSSSSAEELAANAAKITGLDSNSSLKQPRNEQTGLDLPNMKVEVIRTVLSWVLSFTALIVFCLVFGFAATKHGTNSFWVRADVNCWLFLPWIAVFAVIGNDSLLPKWVIKACTFLGDISFSFYLIHDPILNYAQQGVSYITGDWNIWRQFTQLGPVMLRAVWLLIPLLFMSWGLYHHFEMPAQKWLREKLLPAPPARGQAATTPTAA